MSPELTSTLQNSPNTRGSNANANLPSPLKWGAPSVAGSSATNFLIRLEVFPMVMWGAAPLSMPRPNKTMAAASM
eukprot:912927-Pyramimonas_sp.AAC.1